MNPTQIRRELLSKKVIENLKRRNISGYYAKTKEEAKTLALGLINKGDIIGFGGSKSVEEIGLIDAMVKDGSYNLLLRNPSNSPEEAFELNRKMFYSDCYFMSTNALTEDGILVNIDARSNRVAALCFGPLKVVMIVGMNKVEKDEAAAMQRARNIAAPINAQRFDIKTPCKTTGSCADCKSLDSICCQFVTTRFSRETGRMHVILVEEDLGF